MIALSVNLNKIALLRNSREGENPDPVEFARLCLENGCQGITVHPRPDQRHIRPDDCHNLTHLIRPLPQIEFNIEGNPLAPARGSYPGFIELVEETHPDQCTLVPDGDDQLTSDHGFNLYETGDQLRPIIKRLKALGIRVSLFMDPDLQQISLAKEIGADRIELYTGPFAEAFAIHPAEAKHIFEEHEAAAVHAHNLGLGVNAGHDLNLENLLLYRTLPHLAEVSIGHALTIDALKMGMANAVERYRTTLG